MNMNKTLSVMLAAGLLVSGVAGAAEKPAAAFTPEQEARIGENREGLPAGPSGGAG